MNFPLATSSWDEQELNAIQDVVDSGIYTMGENVKKFEEEYAKFIGSEYCVMVNSGSSANLLAVGAMFFLRENRLLVGDEVIVPAVSWSTSYFPLQQYGLKVTFVDIDIHTLNYDLEALEHAITEKTRLILIVNLLGNPNDYAVIQKVILGRNIRLLEDNCESMGATYEGKCAGTFGIMGTFSSFFSHHISTMEGGLVVTDDEELYHIMLSLRAHGWTRNLPDHNLVTGVKSDNPFEEGWKFVLPGYNLRPLEMSGAIGLAQLKKLPALINGRRENARGFQELFFDHPHFIIQSEIGSSSWFGFSFVIRQDVEITRSQILRLLSDNKIETRPIVAGNFTRNKVIQYFSYKIQAPLTAADAIHDRGFFIGNHHYDVTEKLQHIEKILAL